MNILVTGGSRGIGFSIVQECVRSGHSVCIASRHEESVEAALRQMDEFRGSLWGFSGDIADPEIVDELAQVCDERKTNFDVLVMNAGVFYDGTLSDSRSEDFQETLRVNFESSYYIVKKFVDHLRKSTYPRVIIIGSTAAYEPYPVGALYGVSKWALRGYAINLRKELMSDGIGVTFVAPGGTFTDLWKDDDVPPERLMETSDIGKLVVATLSLSRQAVVEELIVRPMLGDIHK